MHTFLNIDTRNEHMNGKDDSDGKIQLYLRVTKHVRINFTSLESILTSLKIHSNFPKKYKGGNLFPRSIEYMKHCKIYETLPPHFHGKKKKTEIEG